MKKGKSAGIYVYKDVLNSAAVSSLRKASSLIVYIDFLQKRRMVKLKRKRGQDAWLIENNGKIEYTYSEAKKNRGFTKPRFKAALKDLVEKGLIDITHSGGGYDGDKSLYAISDRWKKYGTPEFEFKTMLKDIRQGRGFAIVHKQNKQMDEVSKKSKPKKLLRRKK